MVLGFDKSMRNGWSAFAFILMLFAIVRNIIWLWHSIFRESNRISKFRAFRQKCKYLVKKMTYIY